MVLPDASAKNGSGMAAACGSVNRSHGGYGPMVCPDFCRRGQWAKRKEVGSNAQGQEIVLLLVRD